MADNPAAIRGLVVIAAIEAPSLEKDDRYRLVSKLSSEGNAGRSRTYDAEIRLEVSATGNFSTIDQHQIPTSLSSDEV